MMLLRRTKVRTAPDGGTEKGRVRLGVRAFPAKWKEIRKGHWELPGGQVDLQVISAI